VARSSRLSRGEGGKEKTRYRGPDARRQSPRERERRRGETVRRAAYPQVTREGEALPSLPYQRDGERRGRDTGNSLSLFGRGKKEGKERERHLLQSCPSSSRAGKKEGEKRRSPMRWPRVMTPRSAEKKGKGRRVPLVQRVVYQPLVARRQKEGRSQVEKIGTPCGAPFIPPGGESRRYTKANNQKEEKGKERQALLLILCWTCPPLLFSFRAREKRKGEETPFG